MKSTKVLYADVIVDISVDSLDKPYQYRIPEGWEERVTAGTPVMIPFGRGNRLIKGYVVGTSDVPQWDVNKIKCIASIEKNGITASEQLLSLAYWIKERYGSTLNDAIKTVLPVKKAVKKTETKIISLNIDREKAKAVLAEYAGKKNAAARERLLRAVIDKGAVEYSDIRKSLNISMQTVNSLVSCGVIRIENERIYRNPVDGSNCSNPYVKNNITILNEEQQYVADSIINRYKEGLTDTCLIHGVTGSGKTEVYMSIMEAVIAGGRQVIMLIPEIALTYQTVSRFYARFGDRVSVLNSRMSAGERYDQYERAASGLVDIIIGPRSALFVPFEKLGLIVMDEEHEDSYKSEMPPKYHAREVAAKRAELAGAMLILGSATPSVESYYKSELPEDMPDRIIRYELTNRAMNRNMPLVSIVDMREEFRQKNYSIFSRELHDRIQECIARREQIILFLNRRGYQGFVSCRSCGEAVKCPHCDISLTIHNVSADKKRQKMICHYCGYENEAVNRCPSCGSPYIGGFGVGTQMVEERISLEFPGARVLRMDADTTSGKEGHSRILDKFAKHEADILVGTQMIVKGHDFPKVTLVGVLAADMSLHMSDFRASEKTFDLLVQAAGRAGRGELSGSVVIQTYQPDNYAVTEAAAQDYKSFYEKEILFRKLMHYPPCSFMMTVYIAAADDEAADNIINMAAKAAKECISGYNYNVNMIGPARHSVMKVNDNYRYILYIKGETAKELVRIRECIDGVIGDICRQNGYIVQYDMQ